MHGDAGAEADITSDDQACHGSVDESVLDYFVKVGLCVLAELRRTQWLHLFLILSYVFHAFPVIYPSWSFLIRHKSLISAHDILMCPCSPPFHSRLRGRHCLNCHILAAIEASNSLTRVRWPFSSIFILESQLSCFRLQAFPWRFEWLLSAPSVVAVG